MPSTFKEVDTPMNVRSYDQKQKFLLPPSLNDFLPDSHEAHVINDVVETLDLTSFYNKIPDVGNPSFHPKLMIKLLFYGLVEGITSSRVLARKCGSDVAYMFLAALQKPDFRTICKFRVNNINGLIGLFAQITMICKDMGLVSMEHISVDGSKFKANASAVNLYDKDRAGKHLADIEQEIKQRLEEMARQDKLEDQEYGENVSGYEMPEELKNLEYRKKKLEQLIEKLENEKPGKKRNTTDAEAEIQKTDFGKTSGYNGQVSADSKHKIIVAADVTDSPSDVHQLKPMVEQSERNTGQEPKEVSADAGYSSYDNLEYLSNKTDGYMPDKAYQHQIKQGNKSGTSPFDKLKFQYIPEEDVYVCPEGAKAYPPEWVKYCKKRPQRLVYTIKGTWRCARCKHSGQGCTSFGSNRTITISGREHLVSDMRKKLQTEKGKEKYGQRQHVVETVFGCLKHNLGFREFKLRGLKKVKLEFKLWCMGYNLKKIILHGT
jgi:transposase